MALGLRLSGRKAWSCVGEGIAGLLWPVPRQRVQDTICGGSGSAERMRIVPRPRQVGHSEGMGLLGCVDAGRAACSRAGRAVNFRQCHRRGGNMVLRESSLGFILPAVADCLPSSRKSGGRHGPKIGFEGHRDVRRKRTASHPQPRPVVT